MLIDSYNRKINYLRVSVTQRCNFRCRYCMPNTPFDWMPKEDILEYEDLFKIIKLGIDNGINKVRLTGGEPLLRKDIDVLIKMIYNYKNDIDLALTTNGYYLKEMAIKLKEAGLKRINISLDSLKRDVIIKIAQKDVLDEILEGIEEANRVGLKVKINSVPLKGINDNEIIDILNWCYNKGFVVRFIEFMENSFADDIKGLNAKEILDIISKKYSFEEIGLEENSPARYYRLSNGYKFGIIEPHKDDFCKSCNRLRLTANGEIIPCLYFEDAVSLKDSIKKDDINKAKELLQEVVKNKPEKNKWGELSISDRAFYETGG